MRRILIGVFGLGVLTGSGQQTPATRPPVARPPVGTPGTTSPGIGTVITIPPVTGTSPGNMGIVVPLPPGTPVAPPLSVQEVGVVRQRLETYANRMRQEATRSSEFRTDRHSAENDAIERAVTTPSGELSPIYVGRLRPLSGRRAGEVDPGLASAARSALSARLGREPTGAELNAELRAFDARIAEVNRALAGKRAEIAKAVKRDGAIPRTLDMAATGSAPRDPQLDSAAAQEGIRAVIQLLLTR